MSDYTPSTERVRTEYAKAAPRILRPAFDRWLADHDREVAARAWDEGLVTGWDDGAFSDNPYRDPALASDAHLEALRSAAHRVADQNGGE